MARGADTSFAFSTPRLVVDEWHRMAEVHGIDLVEVVSGVLTERTTAALPPSWQGDFDAARATAWIQERDAESPTLLAIERDSDGPAGLVVLFLDASDVRLGYVLAEGAWGRGLATELVAGVVAWARGRADIVTITGGVDAGNTASANVLTKTGFAMIEARGSELIYQLQLTR